MPILNDMGETIMTDHSDKIKQVIIERLELTEDELTLDSDIQKDLGADSLSVVELIMELEDAFNIEIPDEEAEKLRTIRDVVEYVDAKLSESNV